MTSRTPRTRRFSQVVAELKVEDGHTIPSEKTQPEDFAALQKKKEMRHFWVVLFGFFILMVESGVRQVLNVFSKFVRDEFDCAQTTADIAIVVLPNAASLFSGPAVAIFYQMYGARVGIIVGGLLSATGFILASLCSSIYRMFFYTFLTGIGCGLMRNAIMSVQCEYFSAKRRNLVLSFICIGPGVAIFLFPRIIMPIIEMYNWKVAWRFLASLYVICAVMGAFITKKSSVKANSLGVIFGFKVWSNMSFIFHEFASFCASAVCIVYVSHTLMWMRNENIAEPEINYTYNGIASIIARVGITIIMEVTDIPLGLLMVISYPAGQLSMAAAAFCSTDLHFKIQNFMSGFGFGVYQAVLGPYLVRIVGCSVLPNALGYVNLVNGVAAMSSVYSSAWLVSLFGTLNAEFIYIGVLAVLSCVFSALSFFFVSKQKARTDTAVCTSPEECAIYGGQMDPVESVEVTGRRATVEELKPLNEPEKTEIPEIITETADENDAPEAGSHSTENRKNLELEKAASTPLSLSDLPSIDAGDSEPDYDIPYSPKQSV